MLDSAADRPEFERCERATKQALRELIEASGGDDGVLLSMAGTIAEAILKAVDDTDTREEMTIAFIQCLATRMGMHAVVADV